MMISSANSYLNPFSEGGSQSRKDFFNLGLAHRVFTVFLSALAFIATLYVGGVAGYATFKALVDRFQPIKNGEDPATDKITAVATERLPKQTKPVPFEKLQPVHPKYRVDVVTVEQLFRGMETELNLLDQYLNSNELSDLVSKALREKGTLKIAYLSDLATVYNYNHFQIMETSQTVDELISYLEKSQIDDLVDRVKSIKEKYQKLLKKHSEAFKDHQKEIGAIFLEVHQSLVKDMDIQLGKADESTLFRFDQMMRFVISLFDSIEKSDPVNYAAVEQSNIDWLRKKLVSMLPGQQSGPQEGKPTYWHELALEPARAFHLKLATEKGKRLSPEMTKEQALLRTTAPPLPPPKIQQDLKTPPKSEKLLLKSFFSLFTSQVEPGGIPNLGNTCYMNSSLQVIMNTSLAQYIDRDNEAPRWSDFSEIEIDEHELEVTQHLYRENPLTIEDLELREAMGLYCDACDDYSRISAHLNAFQTFKAVYEGKIPGIKVGDAAKIVRGVVWDPDTRLVELRGSMYSQQDAAELMTAALRGIGYSFKMRKLIESEDRNDRSSREESCSYLSLPLVKGKSTLQDLLEAYKTEQIDSEMNVWNIEEGGYIVRQHQRYSNTYTIVGEIPDTMVIQLKRFKSDDYGRLSKDSTKITVGDEVDLGTIIDDELKREGVSTRYRVVAHIDHGGGLQGGHYTADVKIGNNWSYRSDDSVKAISTQEEKKHRASAYVYVLERIKE